MHKSLFWFLVLKVSPIYIVKVMKVMKKKFMGVFKVTKKISATWKAQQLFFTPHKVSEIEIFLHFWKLDFLLHVRFDWPYCALKFFCIAKDMRKIRDIRVYVKRLMQKISYKKCSKTKCALNTCVTFSEVLKPTYSFFH